MLELMVVVAIIGILSAMATPRLTTMVQNTRTKTAARGVAEMLAFANSKAQQTGDPYLVLINADTTGAGLTLPDGRSAAVLVVADTNEDCQLSAGEESWGLESFESGIVFQMRQTDGVSQIVGDAGSGTAAATQGWGASFSEPGNDNARWVLFGKDGIPRRFELNADCDPDSQSEIGRGGGTIYVAGAVPGNNFTTGRQYAIELAPLGGVNVWAFNWSTDNWRVR